MNENWNRDERKIAEEYVTLFSGKCKADSIVHALSEKEYLRAYIQERMKNDSFCKDMVDRFFKRLNLDVDKGKKNNPARDYYDDYCANIIEWFPEIMDLVCAEIMKSPYGGITALRCVSDIITERESIRRNGNLGLISGLEQATKNSILSFCEHYMLGKADLIMMKQESAFLENLGLDPEELREL